MANNYCTKCGNKLKKDEKFCTKCGNNINGILNTSVITPAKKFSNKQGEMSIVGFILSLIGILSCGFTSIFGLIFSIIGLVKDKKKGQKYDLAIVGIIFSVCSIMLWVVLFMLIILAKDVEVIDFSDMTYEEAVKYCETSELNCFPAKTYSDTVPEGGFIRQSVEPGEKLKSIFSVGVWYSKGKEVKNEEKSSEEVAIKNLRKIDNDKLKRNFIKACKEIKMDVSDIEALEKVDDWNSGPRYTFNYKNQAFILYALDNGEVSSITIANSKMDKIYLDGYESVNINDFLFDEETKDNLIWKAEDIISSHLKDPSSVNFKSTLISGLRRYDIYQLNGSFTSKNSYGQKVSSVFTIEFKKNGEAYNTVYLNIDGKKLIGSKSNLKEIVRKEIKKDVAESDDGSITIKEGYLGQYGKKDKFDGKEYIRYYIPAGKYKVEALTKNAMLYIETIKLHKEDGFDTATIIKTIKLDKVGDTQSFTIKKDQCISLVLHSQIKLIKED